MRNRWGNSWQPAKRCESESVFRIGIMTILVMCKERCRRAREEKYWAEQESRQGTLYRRLGVLGGLALVVLLM